MARKKTKKTATFKAILDKEGITRSALKTKTGRVRNSNVSVETLRNESEKK